MSVILEITNITKYYGNGSVVTKALDGISFCVQKGEFVAVMGASGSGKSTLLNVIATIDRVSSGDVKIDGNSVCDMREDALCAYRRDKLGFVFQDYNLLDTLTIEENIVLPLHLQKKPLSEIRRELQRTAAALDITDCLRKFPYELSGGQRQRAACARAVITSPSLVLADEPTGALDSKNSKLLMKTLKQLNEALFATVLTVTHDAVVGSYANRLLFLKDGKVWSELIKGDRSQREFYNEILALSASLGGESDVC